LKWHGLVPAETIFKISTQDLFSAKYKPARDKLTEISLAPDFLDVFKEWLLPLKSINEVKQELNIMFQV
ncbi:MAG TPA: hypothetical protein VLI92_05100, partial [Candidatus Saccharimonadales bacterium]|nr:hypothetical protein [Candidatus Saccharimonadales bacterium]